MSLRDSNEIELAQKARSSLCLVRQKLLSPAAKALDSSMPHLQRAIEAVTLLQRKLEQTGHRPAELRKRLELRKEVTALRVELAQVHALMENASAYHLGLARLLAPEDESISYAAGGVITDSPAPTLRLEA